MYTHTIPAPLVYDDAVALLRLLSPRYDSCRAFLQSQVRQGANNREEVSVSLHVYGVVIPFRELFRLSPRLYEELKQIASSQRRVDDPTVGDIATLVLRGSKLRLLLDDE